MDDEFIKLTEFRKIERPNLISSKMHKRIEIEFIRKGSFINVELFGG